MNFKEYILEQKTGIYVVEVGEKYLGVTHGLTNTDSLIPYVQVQILFQPQNPMVGFRYEILERLRPATPADFDKFRICMPPKGAFKPVEVVDNVLVATGWPHEKAATPLKRTT